MNSAPCAPEGTEMLTREQMAMRVAQE
ncbi:succinyl-CoA--3-ketoacid-CoA transferase, partial [Klebsiella pneumoniae]